MKKILVACVMLAVMLSMCIPVLANPGGFIESPSNNQAPTLIGADNVSEDCVAQLIITAYADRDELPLDIRQKLEEAYAIIVANPDLSVLNAALKDIAAANDIDVTDLAVSDMFDISATDCVAHENHGHFDITLRSESLKGFVCLLHYYNGVWRIVENAEVTNNGTHLEFDEDEFSPFAIVVNAAAAQTDAPATGDMSFIFIAIALVCAVVIVFLTAKYKKIKS